MEKELQKMHPTCCNLLKGQDFLQILYQFFLITFLKEFINLNVNTNMMIKNVKHAELNSKITKILKNMCLKIYELNPAKFLTAPGLACQADSKRPK